MSRCTLSSAAPGGSAASRPACSRPRKIAAGRSTRAACLRTADLHTSMSVRCISMSVRTRSSKHDSSRCFCLEASASLRRGAIHKHPDYRVELACWFANWSVWILDRTALLRLIDTSWRISKTAKLNAKASSFKEKRLGLIDGLRRALFSRCRAMQLTVRALR